MLQFYFLSILLNIIAGFILIYSEEPAFSSENSTEEKSDTEDSAKNDETKPSKKFLNGSLFLEDQNFRLIIAILSGIVGIMKLLSTVQNDIPFIGDLIPAIAGFASCFTLLLDYYSSKSKIGLTLPSILNTIFISGRKYLGIFCIIAGILHFIFPRVLFL